MQPEFKIKKEKTGVIQLEVTGELTAQYSTNFKGQLIKCLNRKIDIEVSLEHITSIDVTTLQLIEAVRSELSLPKRNLSIIPPQDSGVSNLLLKSGLQQIIANKNLI